jgi:hypothetical protein
MASGVPPNVADSGTTPAAWGLSLPGLFPTDARAALLFDCPLPPPSQMDAGGGHGLFDAPSDAMLAPAKGLLPRQAVAAVANGQRVYAHSHPATAAAAAAEAAVVNSKTAQQPLLPATGASRDNATAVAGPPQPSAAVQRFNEMQRQREQQRSTTSSPHPAGAAANGAPRRTPFSVVLASRRAEAAAKGGTDDAQ